MMKTMFCLLFILCSCTSAPYNLQEHCSKESWEKYNKYNENNSQIFLSVLLEEVDKLIDAEDPNLLSCYGQYSSELRTDSCLTFAASKEKIEYVEVNDIVNPLDKKLRACLEGVIKRLDVKSLSIDLPFAYMIELYFYKGRPYHR